MSYSLVFRLMWALWRHGCAPAICNLCKGRLCCLHRIDFFEPLTSNWNWPQIAKAHGFHALSVLPHSCQHENTSGFYWLLCDVPCQTRDVAIRRTQACVSFFAVTFSVGDKIHGTIASCARHIFLKDNVGEHVRTPNHNLELKFEISACFHLSLPIPS